jgi:hypothetical protein
VCLAEALGQEHRRIGGPVHVISAGLFSHVAIRGQIRGRQARQRLRANLPPRFEVQHPYTKTLQLEIPNVAPDLELQRCPLARPYRHRQRLPDLLPQPGCGELIRGVADAHRLRRRRQRGEIDGLPWNLEAIRERVAGAQLDDRRE